MENKNNNNDNLNNSPIKQVMIYPYSARVTRVQKVKLDKDINKLAVLDLPQTLYKESVKADIVDKDDAIVKSINLKEFYEKKTTSNELNQVKEELKTLYRKRNYMHKEMDRLNDSFLKLSLTPMTPTDTNNDGNIRPMPLFPKSWESYLDYLRTLLTQNRKEHRKILLESIELEKQIKQKSKEEQRLSSYYTYKSYGAEVILASNTEGEAELQLSYIVPNASWFPVYDLRVDYGEKSATLTTYGIIQQKTGEDWEDVLLSLSTASPTFSTDTVKLSSWRIRQKDTEVIKQQINVPLNAPSLQAKVSFNYERGIADRSDEIESKEVMSKKQSLMFSKKRRAKKKSKKSFQTNRQTAGLGQQEIDALLSTTTSDDDIQQIQQSAGVNNVDLMSKKELINDLSQQENIAQEQMIFGTINKQNVMDRQDYDTSKQRLQKRLKSKNLEQIEQSVQNKYHTALKNNILDTFSYEQRLKQLPAHKSAYRYRRQDVLRISGGYDYRYSSINPETIPSQNDTAKVTLKLDTQPVELTYQTIPLVSKNVYLKANYKNDSDAPLLAGQVRVFIDADFIGESQINTVSTGEYASFSLGTDNDIKVIRREKSKKETSGVFNKSFIRKYNIEIELMNYKEEEVKVEVLDRIPKSRQRDDVSVFDESFSIQPDKKTYRNILKWTVKLKPQEKKLITFSYKIKHPEDFQLAMYNDSTPYKEGEK